MDRIDDGYAKEMRMRDLNRDLARERENLQGITDEISRRCEAGQIAPYEAARKLRDAEEHNARRCRRLIGRSV